MRNKPESRVTGPGNRDPEWCPAFGCREARDDNFWFKFTSPVHILHIDDMMVCINCIFDIFLAYFLHILHIESAGYYDRFGLLHIYCIFFAYGAYLCDSKSD